MCVECGETIIYPTPAGVECQKDISFSTNIQTRRVWNLFHPINIPQLRCSNCNRTSISIDIAQLRCSIT
ncbi:MAG: hypothetical protein WCR42_15550 [bacterium]